MKLSIVITLLVCSMVCSNSYGQAGELKSDPNAIDTAIGGKSREYSFKTAHPNAQALMKEDFFWSNIEESGPFGSDAGWEAAQGFRQWRDSNRSVSAINYLDEVIAGWRTDWQHPFLDLRELDTAKIKAFITSAITISEAEIQQKMQEMKAVMKNIPDTVMQSMDDATLRTLIIGTTQEMAGIYLLGQDNSIIGTGFAQLALEGTIDSKVKVLTATAIKRQLLPVLLNRYDEGYRNIRKEQLTKMLGIINKAR